MSTLIERVSEAEKTAPLARSSGQLRLLVAQGVDLNQCIPLAIEKLEENPLICAEYFYGDLLEAVLSIDPNFWHTHQDLWMKVHAILDTIDQTMDQVSEARMKFSKPQ